MAITEQRIIKQVSVLPSSGAINVQWANQVLRDGEVISEEFERKAYAQDQLATFHAEVGTFDVDAFTQGFNTAAIDALTTAQAEIARLTALLPDQAANNNTPAPTGPLPPKEALARLDAENTLTQRNLREFILLTAEAIKQITDGSVDLGVLPGIAKVASVEAEAAALRARL